MALLQTESCQADRQGRNQALWMLVTHCCHLLQTNRSPMNVQKVRSGPAASKAPRLGSRYRAPQKPSWQNPMWPWGPRTWRGVLVCKKSASGKSDTLSALPIGFWKGSEQWERESHWKRFAFHLPSVSAHFKCVCHVFGRSSAHTVCSKLVSERQSCEKVR